VSGRGTRAIEVARDAGVDFVIHEYDASGPPSRDRAGRPSYGAVTVAALGADPERVCKTLIADVDGRLVAAVVPVARELDLKLLAAALGARRATMADPTAAERATGYVVGGISPLGGRRALPTVVDADAAGHPTILVSAGRRGLQLELAPADLVALVDARVAALTRRP
jgi:Cys-tRNA(Pro)/Cys-tRNA(Cys) deacylase